MKTTDASRELTNDELDGVSGGFSLAEIAVGVGLVAGYEGASYAMKPTLGDIAKKVIN